MMRQPSFLNAMKWSYISVWGERAFSVLFNFMLAAFLGPRDFGLVVIAGVYVAFVQMFLDQGLASALIQRKILDRQHLDSVFWTNIVLSLALVAISLLGGHWWAAVNHAPAIAVYIYALSMMIPIEALSVVPRALIQRNMNFKSLSIRANACVLVSGVVGVALAYEGFGPWALIWQQIISSVVSVPLLWAFCNWRPQLRFSWHHLRSLLGFSVSNFAAQMAVYAEIQSGSLLIGVILGPQAVGLYRLADRVVSTVFGLTIQTVQAVSLPEFSRLQKTPELLRNSVLTCIRFSSTLALPALSGLAVVADPLMENIGHEWLPSADVLRILCLLNMVLTFAMFTAPLLQAIGNPRKLAILEWARTLAGIILFLIAGVVVENWPLQWQLIGITMSRFALGALVITPVFLYILIRESRISISQLVVTVLPSVVASACIAAAVLSIYVFGLVPAEKPMLRLLLGILVGMGVGFAVLLSLDPLLRHRAMNWYQKYRISWS